MNIDQHFESIKEDNLKKEKEKLGGGIWNDDNHTEWFKKN